MQSEWRIQHLWLSKEDRVCSHFVALSAHSPQKLQNQNIETTRLINTYINISARTISKLTKRVRIREVLLARNPVAPVTKIFLH